jgi:hypothetical protein
MTNEILSTISKGDRVRIVDHPTVPIKGKSYREQIGKEFTVLDARGDAFHLEGHEGHVWVRQHLAKVGDDEVAPARPTIDFSGDSRATAREYATNILTIVGPTDKPVGPLVDVANGYVADAYALNAALIASLRIGLNKGRNADTRRSFGTKVAYLAHITQAVLENHADQLPAYVAGQRSRKVEGLQAELSVATAAFDAAKRNYDNAEEEIKRTRSDLDFYKREADKEISRLMSLLDQRAAEVADKQDVNESLTAVLEYARTLLSAADEHAASQVAGFLDAHGLVLNDA